MKHFYLLLLFVFAFTANAQIQIGPVSPYTICQTPFTGFAAFNLQGYKPVVLGSLNPALYSVSFHILDPSVIPPGPANPTLPALYINTVPVQTIYARVTENANTDNFGTAQVLLAVEPQTIANTVADVAVCDNDGISDGITDVDLTELNAEIIGLQGSPVNYSVQYFLSETDALSGTNAITNPELYTTGSATLWAKISNSQYPNGCPAYTSFGVNIVPVQPVITLPVLYQTTCTGERIFNLTLNNNLYNPDYMVTFYATEADANTGINTIATPAAYQTFATSVWVRIVNATSAVTGPECFTILSQPLSGISGMFQSSVLVNGYSIIVEVTGGTGPFQYAIDNNAYQILNVFTNVAPGMHNIRTQDACGNVIVMTIMVTLISPPAGLTSQTFTQGETLANLEVNGQNIHWYSSETGNDELPTTTLLVNNTTYYAGQAVNGYPSSSRLAVTATLALGLAENTPSRLTVYPNPASTVLTLQNTSVITGIEVYNTLGQQVLNKLVNSTDVNVDVSALTNGVYFVKVQATDGETTVRIVKE